MSVFPRAGYNTDTFSPPNGDGSPWGQGDSYHIGDDLETYPDQIIYRKLPDPENDENRGVPTLEHKEFTTQLYNSGGSKPYWNLWSLLGLFLSLKYKAKEGSTKREFFARLAAMYGWWCRTMVSNVAEVVKYPAVFQCTWGRVGDSGDFDLFLGHSFGGVKVPKNAVAGEQEGEHPWMTAVKQGRYNLLEYIVQTDLAKGWSFEKSPMRDLKKKGKAGTRFGNCGETYPFLSLVV